MMNLINRKTGSLRLVIIGLALWFSLIACGLSLRTTAVGDLVTEEQSVELGSLDSARVQIEFPAGILTVDGGADQLMQAEFRYNVPDWQPQVKYAANGSQGDLVITTEGDKLPIGNELINEWDIRLNGSLPLDIKIQTGASQSNLDLSALDLSTLQMEIGTGATNLDLSGDWGHDVTVEISAGVGDLSIELPADMGVRINTDTALVNITASGLKKDDQGYVNDALGTAPYTLTLEIDAGVGSISLTVP